MALQDQPQNPATLIDPATGQPYPFGSPGYEAAIAPWITGQIKSQAENAANARGTFYSGPAMADEIQAQQGALSAMAQQGAQQSVQEQELQQQEEFAQQQQNQMLQAQSDMSGQQSKAAMLGGAMQGGTGALGTLGGLYMASKMGLIGHGAAAAAAPGAVGAAGAAAPGAALADSVSAAGAAPAWGAPEYSLATAGTGVGQGAAGASSTGAAVPASVAPASVPWLGAGLAGLGGGILGSQAGLRTFGHSDLEKAGAGVGGLGGAATGALMGMEFGGPLGALAGAGLGAAGGSFLGPGVVKGVGHMGSNIGEAANWIGSRLGF